MSESYDNSSDFTQILMQHLASKHEESKTPLGGFDPYKAMLNKKKLEDGEPIDTTNTVTWPEKDLKTLQDFCQKQGIIGFNSGRMSPIAALAFLKNKLGISAGPLSERVPHGYQSMTPKKTLLNG